MVKVNLVELMEERSMSYYRLARQTGVAHSTFLRLARGETQSITFLTLEAIYAGLECTPNDLLVIMPGGKRRPK